MNVQRLYKRNASLTIIKPKSSDQDPLVFGRDGTNAIVITDLRFSFQCEKHLGREPNTATLEITNLSESARAAVQRKPREVRLECGYDGRTARVFTGTLVWAESARDGSNWTTRMELADGGLAFHKARVNASFKGGVTRRAAIEAVAASMGLTLPRNAKDVSALTRQFAGGVALHGQSEIELTRLLEPTGLDWSIQNGTLQILGESESLPRAAFLIDQSTGMIGSPEYGSPAVKGKPPILKLELLLQPEIEAGALIDVVANNINGLFRVERVLHSGDTHGPDWLTQIEAKALR